MISRNRLLALFAVAVLVLGVGLLMGQLRKTKPDAAVGTKILPALAAGLNDVDEVRVFTAGNKRFVTVKRAPDKSAWQVVERDNYPADFGKLREFLMKLAELEVVEVKTSSPESYAQIGVEDVKSDKATGKRVELGGLSAPLALIVGKSTSYSSNYVRLDGQATSYLAKPQIFVYSEPQVWLDRSLFDLPTERVQEVRVELADAKAGENKYTITREVREQTDFTVPGLPKGKKLSHAGSANAGAGSLGNLSFEDVRATKADDKWDQGVSRAEFRLFDGTLVTVLGRKQKVKVTDSGAEAEKAYVKFAFAFDEAQNKRFLPKPAENKDAKQDKDGKPAADANKPADANAPKIATDAKATPAGADPGEVRAQVQKLNEKTNGWIFELPSYKYDTLFRPLGEMLEKK